MVFFSDKKIAYQSPRLYLMGKFLKSYYTFYWKIEDSAGSSVSIMDVLGYKMYSRKIDENKINFEIDLSEFKSGIYLIEFINSGRKTLYKLVLQNR